MSLHPTPALLVAALALVLGPRIALAQETTIDLSGEVDDTGPDHVRVPFDVPEGTAERIGISKQETWQEVA